VAVNSLLAQIGGNESLESIAPWPDAYANSPQGAWSAELHFATLPLNAPEFIYSRDCVDNWCVVGAILNYTKVVLSQYNPSSDKHYPISPHVDQTSEPPPLSFLIHFVGDCHQPLHIAYGCDQGGNLVNVTMFGEPRVLHGTWDATMITEYEHVTGDGWRNVTDEIQTFIKETPSFYEYYYSNLNPSFWANDSYQFVLYDCYVFVLPEEELTHLSTISGGSEKWKEEALRRGRSVVNAYPGPCPIPYVVDLPLSYYYQNIEVIKLQLAKAGVRGAALLNSMFPPTPSFQIPASIS